ncbi:MAG: prephenate dehydrogenase/arogenate dehydrogenase family protein [Gammaproteobacteria bacterium]|nr:prephenate dehydrogenase/arogenate dehydrogenase family protein [Gammaproteobacteria bacterium]
MINRLCIIGVGLIGGSLARALKQANACNEIVGCGRDQAELEKACDLGVIDRFELDVAHAVAGADIVVVAVPVSAMASVFSAMAGHLADNAVLTDVGSSKGSVVIAAQQAFGEVPANLVPGHPIAGTEKNGVDASFAELYQGRRVILTPLSDTRPEAIKTVRNMWQQTGAHVEEMGVQHHDEVLAATSHLPHVLAYTLVDSLAQGEVQAEIFRYAAGGFTDFTRIASSDPAMWHDICLANREALLKVLETFSGDLAKLTEAINNADSEYLMRVFKHAKAAREHFAESTVPNNQSSN